jgi:Flp pilus assembly protein TadG
VSDTRPRCRLRNRLRDCRGVVAVEFAIVAVVLVTLLLGVVEIGRYQFTLQSLRQVAALSARRALVDANWVAAQHAAGITQSLLSGSALKTAVTSPLNPTPMLQPGLLTLTTAYTTLSGADFVTVTATYPFQFVALLLPRGALTLQDVAALPF